MNKMNSEIKHETKNSSFKLYNREKVELTGILKILNLNSEEFLLETTLGKVLVLYTTVREIIYGEELFGKGRVK